MKSRFLGRLLSGCVMAVAALAFMAGSVLAKTTLTVYTALEAEELEPLRAV